MQMLGEGSVSGGGEEVVVDERLLVKEGDEVARCSDQRRGLFRQGGEGWRVVGGWRRRGRLGGGVERGCNTRKRLQETRETPRRSDVYPVLDREWYLPLRPLPHSCLSLCRKVDRFRDEGNYDAREGVGNGRLRWKGLSSVR